VGVADKVDSPKKIPEYAVYNRFEVRWKSLYGRVKGMVLRPLVLLLHRVGISSDSTSFAGFLVALAFFVVFARLQDFTWAPWLLVLYIFADNLDGALADYSGAKESGPIVDNFFDLASLAVIVLALAEVGAAPYWLGVIFVGLYVGIIVGGFILNYNGVTSLLLRVRVIVFGGFFYLALTGGGWQALRYWMAAAVALQIPSFLSVVYAAARSWDRLEFPDLATRLSPNTRRYMVTSLVIVGVLIGLLAREAM
jgi:phosphatidylglycerophosphate synthase